MKNLEIGDFRIYFEINDGQERNITSALTWVRIKTKIEKSSQIVVEINNHEKIRIINQEDVEYTKFYE